MSEFVIVSHRTTWDGYEVHTTTHPDAASVVKAVQKDLKTRGPEKIVSILELDKHPTLAQVRELFTLTVDPKDFLPRFNSSWQTTVAGSTVKLVHMDAGWIILSFRGMHYRWEVRREEGRRADWIAADLTEAKEVTIPQPELKQWVAA